MSSTINQRIKQQHCTNDQTGQTRGFTDVSYTVFTSFNFLTLFKSSTTHILCCEKRFSKTTPHDSIANEITSQLVPVNMGFIWNGEYQECSSENNSTLKCRTGQAITIEEP